MGPKPRLGPPGLIPGLPLHLCLPLTSALRRIRALSKMGLFLPLGVALHGIAATISTRGLRMARLKSVGDFLCSGIDRNEEQAHVWAAP